MQTCAEGINAFIVSYVLIKTPSLLLEGGNTRWMGGLLQTS